MQDLQDMYKIYCKILQEKYLQHLHISFWKRLLLSRPRVSREVSVYVVFPVWALTLENPNQGGLGQRGQAYIQSKKNCQGANPGS